MHGLDELQIIMIFESEKYNGGDCRVKNSHLTCQLRTSIVNYNMKQSMD